MVNMAKKGITISCVYNNKPRTGMVEKMQVVNDRILLTVKTEQGYRAMYEDKMQDFKITK